MLNSCLGRMPAPEPPRARVSRSPFSGVGSSSSLVCPTAAPALAAALTAPASMALPGLVVLLSIEIHSPCAAPAPMDHAPLCVSLLPELFAGGLPQLFSVIRKNTHQNTREYMYSRILRESMMPFIIKPFKF